MRAGSVFAGRVREALKKFLFLQRLPSGAKARHSFCCVCGTTKVVPFQSLDLIRGSLGHKALFSDPSAIHDSNPREQMTDKRDALHILRLPVEDHFPVAWQSPVENKELCRLLRHRCRLVRMRAELKNQLDAIHPADNYLSVG
jgi:hypothetical protein